MYRLLLLSLFWLLPGCQVAKKTSRPLQKDKATGLPIARRLYQLDTVQEGLLRGRRGVLFHVSNAGIGMPEEDDAEMAEECKTLPKDCESPFFHGSDRKAAKLSFNKKEKKEPQKLPPLMDRLLRTDGQMKNHEPAISKDCNSPRLPEEMENVFLEHVFIYVILWEADGDYHLIVGDGIQAAPETLLSIEISALPETTSPYYKKLKKVRDQFESKHSTCNWQNLWDDRDSKPLPEISVKGTLFYDILHAKQGKHSGQGSVKTGTFWEVHPATYIKFWN